MNGGGRSVRDVLAGGPAGPVAVRGFVVTSAGTTVVCDELAESFPPQPGGATMPVEGLSAGDLADARTATHTTWTAAPQVLRGVVRDGVLHVGPR